jgi:ParB family chromosome partitioning protein
VANDEQMLEMALIENIHRENLNAIEVAISYQRLLEECKLTQDKLSEKVGKDRSTVSNFLRLLKLPAEIQIAIRDGYITMGHARALVNISDKSKQLIILKRIIDEDLSVRQVEMLVKDKPAKQPKAIVPESYKIQAEALSKALKMGVKVSRNSKGKGSLTINFKNDEEFERLLDFINKGN